MKTRRVSFLMKTVMAGVIVFGGSTSVVTAQNSAPRVSSPTTELVEQHWQSVLKEQQPARRKILIEEHRRMVDDARKADKDKTAPAGSNEMSMRNTLEMHSIMLDMMK